MMRALNPIERRGIQTHGLLASVVRKESGDIGSLRDSQLDLRTVVHLLPTPWFSQRPIDIVAGPCEFPACIFWMLRPWDPIINPNPLERIFVQRFDPVRWTPHGVGMLHENGLFDDVRDIFSDDLQKLFLEEINGLAWIPASEDPGSLARMGIDRIGALVPREGSLIMSPVTLVMRDGYVTYEGDIEMAASHEEMVGAMQVGSTDRAVYSAVEDRLVIAGWEQGWRSLHVMADSVQTENFEAPTEELRGFTYDTVNNRMFTLELTDVSEKERTASIVWHNPAHGGSKEIWSVPFTGAFTQVAIAADRTGSLVLMATGPTGFQAWRYLVDENGIIDFVAGYQAAGDNLVLLDEPLHSGLKVPLAKDGEAFLLELNVSEFKLTEPCTSL